MNELNQKKSLLFDFNPNLNRLIIVILFFIILYNYWTQHVFSYNNNFIVITNKTEKGIFVNELTFTLKNENGVVWNYTPDNHHIGVGMTRVFQIRKPFFHGELAISDGVDNYNIDFSPRGRSHHSLFVLINDQNTPIFKWDKIP